MTNIETMKLALEALETLNSGDTYKTHNAATALRQAIEKAQQAEPVAWGVDWGKAGDIPCVSIIKRLPDGGIEVLACEYAPYSYTSPPPRQPLTDEELKPICDEYRILFGSWVHDFARAIEAKLKEKNT